MFRGLKVRVWALGARAYETLNPKPLGSAAWGYVRVYVPGLGTSRAHRRGWTIAYLMRRALNQKP